MVAGAAGPPAASAGLHPALLGDAGVRRCRQSGQPASGEYFPEGLYKRLSGATARLVAARVATRSEDYSVLCCRGNGHRLLAPNRE